MSVSVDIVTKGIDILTDRSERTRRQRLYAMRAAKVIEPYVPLEEGALRGSEAVSSDYDAGILTWNTPYAARQYYDEGLEHTTPGTEHHWDQAMWRDHAGDMEDYARGLFMGRE